MKRLRNVNVIKYRKRNELEFLLLKTSGIKGPSIWQAVTGKIDDTDLTIKDTVSRELKEDVGVIMNIDQVIGSIHEFQYTTERKGYGGTLAHQYCFACELPKDLEVRLSHERQEYRWLSFKEVVKLIDYENPKKALSLTFEYVSNSL